jgi:hypothetical protein
MSWEKEVEEIKRRHRLAERMIKTQLGPGSGPTYWP